MNEENKNKKTALVAIIIAIIAVSTVAIPIVFNSPQNQTTAFKAEVVGSGIFALNSSNVSRSTYTLINIPIVPNSESVYNSTGFVLTTTSYVLGTQNGTLTLTNSTFDNKTLSINYTQLNW